MKETLKDSKIAKEEVNYGQISGPVGTYSNIDPKIEELVCQELGLKPARISTQGIQGMFMHTTSQTLALIAATIEQFAD
ncbi:MAG: hypothetical protein MZV70_01745 [Desulfobacterales bacterium]|nr:hypothetical protein [Desulfobacterales bacterium]